MPRTKTTAKQTPPSQKRTGRTSSGPSKAKTARTPQTQSAVRPKLSGPTTKSAIFLGLLRRKDGATLDEMMSATEWQAHSVRGILSGTVKKKLGLPLTSIRDGDGARR